MEPPRSTPPRPHKGGLLLLFVLALGLRLFPIGHGLPDNHVPDTHVVRAALGMANDRDPVPPVGKWSTYPNLLPYVLVPCYAVQYATGRVAGEWAGAGEYGNVLKEQPERAHLLARKVLALLSALLPVLLVLGLRSAGLGAGAWYGGALGATGLLLVHLAVHERPWAPLATATVLALAPAAVHATTGSRRSLVLSGLGAAAAFSIHQAGALTVLIPALAWGVSPLPWRGGALVERLRAGVLCVLAFFAVALTVGHPYLVRYGTTPTEAVAAGEHLEGTSHLAIGGQSVVFALSAQTFQHLSRAFAGYDPLLLLLGLLGLVPALRRRAFVPAAGFALAWGGFFLTNQNEHVRYLVPLAAALCWPAALAFERLGSRGRLVALIALVLPLTQAVRLGVLLRRPDTRALARADLASTPPGGGIAVDVGGPVLPLNERALQRLSTIRPLRTREAHRLALLQADIPTRWGPGMDAVPLEDVFEFDARHHASWTRPEVRARLEDEGRDPNRVLDALRSTHVVLVDRTPADGVPPALLDERAPSQVPGPDLASHAGGIRPKLEKLLVHPAKQIWSPGEGATDARLPLELSFPLTELWLLERPGPLLTLHERLPTPPLDGR